MSHYFADIRLNKNKSETSEKREKKMKRLLPSLVTLMLISLLILADVTLFSVSAVDSEPNLPVILNDLGFH